MVAISDGPPILREFAEHVFESIERTLEDLTAEELTWKPAPTANDIEWILRHMIRISKLLIPQVIRGDTSPWCCSSSSASWSTIKAR